MYEVIPAIEDEKTIGYQIRWHLPDEMGRYYWCGHYFAGVRGDGPSLRWCGHAASLHCARLNLEAKPLPFYFHPINPYQILFHRRFNMTAQRILAVIGIICAVISLVSPLPLAVAVIFVGVAVLIGAGGTK